MNPLTLLKLYSKGNRLVSLFQQGTASYERSHDMSKSLFASKVFWFNALTAAGELVQVLTQTRIVPAGTLAIIGSCVNIGLRLVTTQPVHVVDPGM